MTRISLCSYTYNDAELLHGLLAEIPGWPSLPAEIILMDDGSDEPFTLTEEEKKLPITLLRNPQNEGFTKTKHRAMCAASGDIIVSLDCDVRMQGDFIGSAAQLLRDESIGLVGPFEAGNMSQDLLSEYLSSFGGAVIAGLMDENGETSFINGPALAIRRELWQKIGGYSGHAHARGSDNYLSNSLRSLGYRLLISRDASYRVDRVLSRHSFCRRDWQWCRVTWLSELSEAKLPLPEYARPMLLQTRWRCAKISGEHNPDWLYFELLHLLYIYLEFCNALGPAGKIPLNSGNELMNMLNRRLAKYPALFRLLRADLLRAGAIPLQQAAAPQPEDKSPLATSCQWTHLDNLLQEFEETDILNYLDQLGVRHILDDEAALQTNFSSY